MPRLGDIDQLPYCKAFIREVLRWRPVTPASVPHLATKEEQYKGFIIPVDSVVVQNNWAIFHDPESFDEPEMFRPERYVQNEFGLKAGVDESVWRNTFTFGAGRRICQGVSICYRIPEGEADAIVSKGRTR
jgi:cytochrome P450